MAELSAATAEAADDSVRHFGFAWHKRRRIDGPTPVHGDAPTAQALQAGRQQAIGSRRPMLVGTAAARQQEQAGVWCFLPYGSQALSAIERGPVVRIGLDPARRPTGLASLPNEVLRLITDHLRVPDFARLARAHRLFFHLFRQQIQTSSWANRIVEHVWEREPAGRRRKDSFFSLRNPHPQGKDILPLVTRVQLSCSSSLQVRNLARLTPQVRTIDCAWLDTDFDPSGLESALFHRVHEALLLWPQLDGFIGNKSIVHILRHHAGSNRCLRQFAAVGFQRHSQAGRQVLAPVVYDDSPVGFAELAPWLKPTAKASDPHFLLDIAGLQHLSLALQSVDDLGPRPLDWVRIYGDETARKSRTKLVAYQYAPLFFAPQKGQRELLPEVRARIPGVKGGISEQELQGAASAAPQRMMQSDSRTLCALLRALVLRLHDEPLGSLHTMQLGVALPFFSFHSLVVPVLRELGVAASEGSLWHSLWQSPGANGEPSAHALLQEVFERAPGFGFRLIGLESTWVATPSIRRDGHRALVWHQRRTHELRAVAFWPPVTQQEGPPPLLCVAPVGPRC